MRLTHSVTIHDDAKPIGRKLVYAQVNLDPIMYRPLEICRYDQTKSDDDGTSVNLTWEEFAKVADLVSAHQPEVTAVREECGYDWTPNDGTVRYCCLSEGHTTNGAWLHVAADGSCKTR